MNEHTVTKGNGGRGGSRGKRAMSVECRAMSKGHMALTPRHISHGTLISHCGAL
jgi:hypothetical protein